MQGDLITYHHRNAGRDKPLTLQLRLERNTPDHVVEDNIRTNSARHDLPWLQMDEQPKGGVAVLVGGGPSVADTLADIEALAASGATVFAMNASSAWLRRNGVEPDCQIMLDARPGNIDLLDPKTPVQLLASQVDPSLFDAASNPVLMHLATDGLEDHIPPERREAGGYCMVGGGYGVGNTAICAAYVMGYRELHCFGFDSSHRQGQGHAYDQPLNANMETIETTWAGKAYVSSVAMKAQAERFQVIAHDLQKLGCGVHVHGDGLLPAMWNTRGEDLTEQDKYRLMWQLDAYRESSPGERLVETFMEIVNPDGLIVDFGCGPGRASLRMHENGHDVLLIDFASNCRDAEAEHLPFVEWDLTSPCPIRGEYGFCTDVMEHIPPYDVDAVLRNIMASGRRVFFQISTVLDAFGDMIGHRLHLTVEPHEWWAAKFAALGFSIRWQEDRGNASCFYVFKRPRPAIKKGH